MASLQIFLATRWSGDKKNSPCGFSFARLMSSINTSINMLNGALRAPVFFNCLPRHRSEAHKFFTAQQPVASSNVQWKKTGENEWLIKHSCVKLNHCSENSILHKKSRFNGIYEIELWREKNTRRDLSWAYNFLVSWRYRLRQKSQNYLTFISSKIVQPPRARYQRGKHNCD